MEWKPRILIVDDSAVSRAVFLDLFTAEYGYHVKVVDSAIKALVVLDCTPEEWYPDLIVTDVQMPGMTGLELVSKLGEDPAFDTLSVIIYSGSSKDWGVRVGKKSVPVVSIEDVETAVVQRIKALRTRRDLRGVVALMSEPPRPPSI